MTDGLIVIGLRIALILTLQLNRLQQLQDRSARVGIKAVNARCPLCGSTDVYLSRSGNEGMPLLVQLFLVAGRCSECGRVSLLRGPLLLGPTLEPPQSTKRSPPESAQIASEPSSPEEFVALPPNTEFEADSTPELAEPTLYAARDSGSATSVSLETQVGDSLEAMAVSVATKPAASPVGRPRRTVLSIAVGCGVVTLIACGGAWWAVNGSHLKHDAIPKVNLRSPEENKPAGARALTSLKTAKPEQSAPARNPTAVADERSSEVMPAKDPVSDPGLRVWRDADRTRTARACLHRVDGDHVALIKENGDEVRVPIAALSAEDQAYIRAQSDDPSHDVTPNYP